MPTHDTICLTIDDHRHCPCVCHFKKWQKPKFSQQQIDELGGKA